MIQNQNDSLSTNILFAGDVQFSGHLNLDHNERETSYEEFYM